MTLPGSPSRFSSVTASVLLLLLALSPLTGMAQEGGDRTREDFDKEAALRIANFEIPQDIKASLFADESQTKNPSAICFDDEGRLYIGEIDRWRAGVEDIRNQQHMLFDDLAVTTTAERLAMYEKHSAIAPMSYYSAYSDRIRVVDDTDGDGRADKAWIYADGFDEPEDGPGIGLIYRDGKLYYTNIPHLWLLEDKDGDGKSDERISLQDGFGVRMSISGHDMHGLAWGPDGKLYWSLGDRGYNFVTKEGRYYSEPTRGAVFRCDPDGSNIEEYYRGLRNPQELAFDAYGNLFTCDNDADQWDTGRLVYILEGGDSGWLHGHQALLNFREQLGVRTPMYDHPGHKEIPMNPWMTEGLWETRHEEQPTWILPPVETLSWGPSGLAYNYGATALPARYAEHFFVCNFGGAKGDVETFAVEIDGAGFKAKDNHIFMVGLGNTDVEFGPDGRMYLSCFNNTGWVKEDIGNIYALYHEETLNSSLVTETANLLVSDFDARPADELGTLLGHADLRVRQRAQFALAKKPEEAKAIFTAAAKGSGEGGAGGEIFKRLHGVWGLGMLAREDASLYPALIELVADPDAEVRAQVAKTLGDSRNAEAGIALQPLLKDESNRVKAFAAIGVGKCRNVLAFEDLLGLLAENNNEDAFLRHAGVMGLYYLQEREKMLKKVDDESPGIRLGVLLTLRRLLDPRVKYFLGDPDPKIRDEAIRAINDLDLPTAKPALSEMVGVYAGAADGVALPEDHRDFIIQTRLINAAFRLGREIDAERLLAYAAQAKLPAFVRQQALAALEEWPQPTVVDPTTGIYRPVFTDRAEIKSVVQEGMPKLLETAEGPLLASATRLAAQYDYHIPAGMLVTQVSDAATDEEVRLAALSLLTRQDAPELKALIPALLEDDSAVIRKEAVKAQLAVDPEAGRASALALAESEDIRDRQNAYAVLSGIEAPQVTDFFAARLEQLLAGKEPAATQLDLIEAVEKREEPELKSKIQQYHGSLKTGDLLAPFQVCLEGGDPKLGETIFTTHAAAQCSKCHKVGGTGAEAGPDLAGVGKRQEPSYLLESLVNPSAVVVPGYGITLITLKDGSSLGATVVDENDQEITVKIPVADGGAPEIRKIAQAEIQSRQPPMSAMPPVGLLMTKREVRDLVAYLSSLKKGGEEKKGH